MATARASTKKLLDFETMLTFLHLSDIHFEVFEGARDHDLEDRVRELMLEDIRSMHDSLGDMDGVLVAGDIAAKGQYEEYVVATGFLDRTCEIIGCPTRYVVCVPGNHDIDRTRHDYVHDAVRHHLRTIPPEEISDRLHTLLKQPRGGDVLFSPLSHYNRFALTYGCDIGPEKLTWAPKFFSEGDRQVMLFGITSAWISDAADSDQADESKVPIGAFQCGQLAAERDAVSIAIVHHPPNWTRDVRQVEPWMNRAHIVLTGHEHKSGITLDAANRRVAIASGAVNPERTKAGWIPAYNVLQLERPTETPNEIRLTIHVRCWQGDVADFGPDQRFPDPFEVSVMMQPPFTPEDEADEPEDAEAVPEPEPIDSETRAAIFRIMRAAPDIRHRAAIELGLMAEGEMGGLELDRAILDAASSQQKVRELEERIMND